MSADKIIASRSPSFFLGDLGDTLGLGGKQMIEYSAIGPDIKVLLDYDLR
jgi:hypothetical protein